MTRQKLEDFLTWLITPQNDKEKARFGRVVDDYCELIIKIPHLTKNELMDEIDIQLKPYGLEVRRKK